MLFTREGGVGGGAVKMIKISMKQCEEKDGPFHILLSGSTIWPYECVFFLFSNYFISTRKK